MRDIKGRSIRSKEKKKNNVVIIISGEEVEDIKEELLLMIRKMRRKKELGFYITPVEIASLKTEKGGRENKMKGGGRMKEIDDLIDSLANHIENLIENEGAREHEVAEKTEALANLIYARAKAL